MSTILITGASGFIGGALLERLKKTVNYEDTIHTCGRTPIKIEVGTPHKTHNLVDLSVQSEVEKFLSYVTPDIIFHLAANPNPKLNEKDINSIWRDNVLSTQNLCHFAPKNCTFILASSVVVYGDLGYEEIDIPEPTSIYGLTKFTSEKILQQYDLNHVIVRLCATVGKGTKHGILKDFMVKIHNDSPTFEIWGDRPGSSKPFTYIDDVVKALIHLMKNSSYNIYNICPSDNISCEEIAKVIMSETGIQKEIIWLGEKVNNKGDNRKISCQNLRLIYDGFKYEYPTSKDAILAGIRSYAD